MRSTAPSQVRVKGPRKVAIDLGTRSIAVFQIRHGKPEVLRDVHTGEATSESFLGYENGVYVTGAAATRLKNGAFVSRLKSALGLPHRNMDGTLDLQSQSVLDTLSTPLVRVEFLECARGDEERGIKHPHVTFNNDEKSTILVVAGMSMFITQQLLPRLEAAGVDLATLSASTLQLVITCPAIFTNAQRTGVFDVAEAAGIPRECISRVVSEPVAASFQIYFDRYSGVSCKDGAKIDVSYVVVDIGDGTFDLALVSFAQAYIPSMQRDVLHANTVAVLGASFGGGDFTDALQKDVAAEAANIGFILPEDPLKFREDVERLKVQLCSGNPPEPWVDQNGIQLSRTLADYTVATKSLVVRAAKLMQEFLQIVLDSPKESDRNLLLSDTTQLVFTGGASSDPNFRAAVETEIKKVKDMHVVYPKDAHDAVLDVGKGAVRIVDVLTDVDSSLLLLMEDATPRNILVGMQPEDGKDCVVIMQRGSKFNHRYECPKTFTNAAMHLIPGQLGVVVAVLNYGEGQYSRFGLNKSLGKCVILQEHIEGCLFDKSFLPNRFMTLRVSAEILHSSTINFVVEVRDDMDNVVVPELKHTFVPSGVISRKTLQTVAREVAAQRILDTYAAIVIKFDVAMSGMEVTVDQSILDRAQDAKAGANKAVAIMELELLLQELVQDVGEVEDESEGAERIVASQDGGGGEGENEAGETNATEHKEGGKEEEEEETWIMEDEEPWILEDEEPWILEDEEEVKEEEEEVKEEEETWIIEEEGGGVGVEEEGGGVGVEEEGGGVGVEEANEEKRKKQKRKDRGMQEGGEEQPVASGEQGSLKIQRV